MFILHPLLLKGIFFFGNVFQIIFPQVACSGAAHEEGGVQLQQLVSDRTSPPTARHAETFYDDGFNVAGTCKL